MSGITDEINSEFEHLAQSIAVSAAEIDAVEKQLDTLPEAEVAAILKVLGDEIESKRAGAVIIATVQKILAQWPILAAML
jgi:hypothetical protein